MFIKAHTLWYLSTSIRQVLVFSVVFYFRDDPDSFFADIVGIEDIYSAGSHSEDFIIYRYQIFDRSRYGDIFQRFAIRFHSPDTHQLSLQIGYDSFCRGNGYDLAWKSRLGIEDCTDGTERFGIYNLDFLELSKVTKYLPLILVMDWATSPSGR